MGRPQSGPDEPSVEVGSACRERRPGRPPDREAAVARELEAGWAGRSARACPRWPGRHPTSCSRWSRVTSGDGASPTGRIVLSGGSSIALPQIAKVVPYPRVAVGALGQALCTRGRRTSSSSRKTALSKFGCPGSTEHGTQPTDDACTQSAPIQYTPTSAGRLSPSP